MFDTLTLDGTAGGTAEEMQHKIWHGEDTAHQPYMSIQWNSSLFTKHTAVERVIVCDSKDIDMK